LNWDTNGSYTYDLNTSNPAVAALGSDENLTEKYDFDSIDALELLSEIEALLGSELTREEKKASMDIRTINQICDYIELLAKKRSL